VTDNIIFTAPSTAPSTALGTAAVAPLTAELPAIQRRPPTGLARAFRNPSVVIGGVVVLLMMVIGLLAPFLGTLNPADINPSARNKLPGTERMVRDDSGNQTKIVHRLGTDSLGRDVYSRVLYGARISIFVGVTVAILSISIGLLIGLVSGYVRWLDPIVMRIMDGLMAIPAILLAIALASLYRGTIGAVILAITIPEIPRVVRLVRSVVLSVREEPYVEAAITVGTPPVKLIWRHILPNTIAPMIVQGTFICASAILVEAILSFLGIGISSETPTWGNVMAEGRQVFRIYQHCIVYPGIMLALTVLAVNMLGDGLRDTLDPKLAKRV
jgi:peptide/nickel transport system permease protein